MKSALMVLTLFLSQAAFASDFISEMEKIYYRFDQCDNDDSQFNKDAKTFEKMVVQFKKDDEAGRKSNIEVADFGYSAITLINKKTQTECTMHIDAYEGRCFNVICE